MKVRKISDIICLIMICLFPAQVWATDWGIRGLLPRGTGYYDKDSIKKINKNISRVWTVTIFNEQGKADAFSILKRQNKAPENPEALSQEMILLEFDCVNRKYRIAALDIYDESGNLLLSVPQINDQWHDIIPKSINEKLKDTVCSADNTSRIKSNP